MDAGCGDFLWDIEKEHLNIIKHGVDFKTASKAFLDPNRKIRVDHSHSGTEARLYCIGSVGDKILTVRFLYREGKIRIFGAGFWRKGRKSYEKK